MATFTRKSAWNNGGTFDNPDLLWYAKAVKVMQSLPISNPRSWWFYAAVHGEFLTRLIPPPTPSQPIDYRYLNWINIRYILPAANINSLPNQNLIGLFWNQCQHGTWYFPPWHRGYLVAIENILRDIIITQFNGPADWSLPYWNYFKQSTTNQENTLPPAFTLQLLPDNTPNPLFVNERFGQRVDVGNGRDSVSDLCQWDTMYNEESSSGVPGPGDLYGYDYGGGQTGFFHSPTRETAEKGDLEQNPHDGVHGMIGGRSDNDKLGLLAVPNTAAIDPIFYLHHSNIDRMWATWNVTGNHRNSPESSWLSGPQSQGNSLFGMPLDGDGTPWFFTPEDVEDSLHIKYNGGVYAYTYDDMSLASFNTTPPTQVRRNLSKRLAILGVPDLEKGITMPKQKKNELVGASKNPIIITETQANANVQLSAKPWKKVSRSFLEISTASIPDEVFLQLEGVKGGDDSNFLSVYVNKKFVQTVSLFGLLSASLTGETHGNAGLTFKINITTIVDDLHLDSGKIDVNALDVEIQTKNPVPKGGKITIDRIGVYRSGQ
jgi:tyrosinase